VAKVAPRQTAAVLEFARSPLTEILRGVMTVAVTRKGVVAHFHGLPPALQAYYGHLPALVENFPWDISLIYQFARVELAYRRTLYCGAVKLHKADPDLAWQAVRSQHITRASFRAIFSTVIGYELDPAVGNMILGAESVRDDIMHGKSGHDRVKRDAIIQVLDYSHALNEFLSARVHFRPFGDLRGFKGRGKSLDKNTSRFLLKGLGLGMS